MKFIGKKEIKFFAFFNIHYYTYRRTFQIIAFYYALSSDLMDGGMQFLAPLKQHKVEKKRRINI